MDFKSFLIVVIIQCFVSGELHVKPAFDQDVSVKDNLKPLEIPDISATNNEVGEDNTISEKKVVENHKEAGQETLNSSENPQNTRKNVIREDTEPTESISTSNQETENKENGQQKDDKDFNTGSVCVYCKYCKSCDEKACEEKCPCKPTDNKEICETCKYCKYCHVCNSVCETVCKPGGFLDNLSASVYDALPSFIDNSREEVDKNLEEAKNFIKEYL